MTSAPYKKFPGVHLGFLMERITFWQGETHALLVTKIFPVERYHRFPYKDIRSIVVQRTRHFEVFTGIMILVSALVWGITDMQEPGWVIFSGILTVPLVAWGIWQGPTCRFFIETAVQTTEIKSLRRLRNAKRVLRSLQSLVQQAQANS